MNGQMLNLWSPVAQTELSVQRRNANYKPNIWNYDSLQSLTSSIYSEEDYARQANELKEELKWMFVDAISTGKLSILRLIDSIPRLGLASYFKDELKCYLNSISRSPHEYFGSSIDDHDLYATALGFRLLRQFGYEASQELFQGFVNEAGKFKPSATFNLEPLIELFEVSNVGCEGENILDEARRFCTQKLGWWMELGISQKLSFSRNRMVQSFLYAGGVAYEPEHGSLRKWLSKAIKLVLIIDDVYDIYGSFEDLERFTIAVDSGEAFVNPRCWK
ncbi:OLC1v1000226C2 [Oldenlandia corymbosa var. corymbosa]|uniref:OLC1v1000226C2 n=1 Tax=Oldenlandia corymbosa var. corymbosa TaxID=529605 RepID=A0AAV1D371_OLDCO|nr:OLC1v1000226C2 [Oldenlandia corymbosa var. corymbosa]